mgnify:CR=1 FL=1
MRSKCSIDPAARSTHVENDKCIVHTCVCCVQVLPRFRSLLAGWQPLLDPQRGVAELKAWRGLLEGEGTRQSVLLGGASWEDAGDPYASLVAEVVMSPIR